MTDPACEAPLKRDELLSLLKGETIGAAERGGAARKPRKVKSLTDFVNSGYYGEKDALIRSLAKMVLPALKVKAQNGKSINIDTVPIDKLVEFFRNAFSMAMKQWGVKSPEYRNAVNMIGDAINSKTNNAIDGTLSLENKFRKIAEYLHTLLSSQIVDFAGTVADVERVFNNLQIVRDALDASHMKQLEIIGRLADPIAIQQSTQVEELFKLLKKEYDRQINMLANLLGKTLRPATQDILSALEGTPDMAGFISDLRSANLPEDKFGEGLRTMLSGVSANAYTAKIVRDALQALNISVSDYRGASSPDALRVLLHAKLVDAPHTPREMFDMMTAAQKILDLATEHDKIAPLLLTVKGGCDCASGAHENSDGTMGAGVDYLTDDVMDDADMMSRDENFTGGDIDISGPLQLERQTVLPPYWEQKNLKNQIARQAKLREGFLKSFRSFLKGSFTDIVKAARLVQQRFGKEIPITEATKNFVQQFVNLPNVNKENMHMVLSGYYQSASVKNHRDIFLSSYKQMLAVIDSTGVKDSALSMLRAAIEKMLEEINNFGENVVSQMIGLDFKTVEEQDNSLRRIFGSSEDVENDIFANDSVITFGALQTAMKYTIHIADIKTNIARNVLARQDYSAEYVNILGEEAGFMINKMREQETTATAVFNTAVDVSEELADVPDVKTKIKELYEAHVNRELDARIAMVELAQNIDLVMKSFTESVCKNPDQIKSMMDTLYEIDFISKFYTDRAGNLLAQLFECFSTNPIIRFEDIISDNKLKEIPLGIHYYTIVKNKVTELGAVRPTDMAGGPLHLVELPNMDIKEATDSYKKVSQIMALAEQAVKQVHSIVNILGMFEKISKDGKMNSGASFMNVGQVMSVLLNYIKYSSFVVITKTAGEYINDTNRVTVGYMRDAKINTGDEIYNAVTKSGIAKLDRAGGPGLYLMCIPAYPTNKYFDYHDITKYPYETKLDVMGNVDKFFNTDLLFHMTLKAIVAKILVMVEAFRLFHRPMALDKANALNPTRVMLGGDEVKIVPECVELYLRLPLLAEWYREKFSFKHHAVDVANKKARAAVAGVAPELQTWVIAVMPTIASVWTALVAIVFDKAFYVQDGNYSEPQVQGLIEAINSIYKAYKSRFPTATVRNILNAFVDEMNRVFGFVEYDSIDAFETEKRKYLTDPVEPGAEMFDTLDALDVDNQFGRGPAPSDKFVVGDFKVKKLQKRRPLATLFNRMHQLRNELDEEFNNVLNDDAKRVNFESTINTYHSQISHAEERDKYKIVLGMMQGSSRQLSFNANRILMTHESIVLPLLVLQQYNDILMSYYTSVIENSAVYNQDLSAAGGRDNMNALKLKMPKMTTTWSDKVVSKVGFIGDVARGALRRVTGNTEGANASISDKYFSLLRDLTTSGFASVSISTEGTLSVDFSEVEKDMRLLASAVRKNIETIRSSVDHDEVASFDKFEALGNNYSIRSIEENMTILFDNRDECGLDFVTNTYASPMIKEILNSKKAAMRYDGYLTLANNNFGSGIALGMFLAKSILHTFTTSQVSIINPKAFPYNILSLGVKEPKDTLLYTLKALAEYHKYPNNTAVLFVLDNMGEYVDAQLAGNELMVSVPVVATLAAYDRTTLSSKLVLNNVSLITNLNNILYRVVDLFFDRGENKFYSKLLEDFMYKAGSVEFNEHHVVYDLLNVIGLNNQVNLNGDNTQALNVVFEESAVGGPIMVNLNFPNDVADVENKQRYVKVSTKYATVTASNVLLINELYTQPVTIGSTIKKKLLWENLADVPDRVKDSMKENLPHFIRMLKELRARANYLQMLISEVTINTQLNTGYLTFLSDLPEVTSRFPPPATKAATVEDYKVILARLDLQTTTLINTFNTIYSSLGDSLGYYGEQYKGFFNMYREKNNTRELPIIPVSFMASALRYPRSLLPDAPGSETARFNNTLKTLLLTEPKMDHMPTVKQLYGDYSASIRFGRKITPKEFEDLSLRCTSMLMRLVKGQATSNVYKNEGLFDVQITREFTENRADPYAENGPGIFKVVSLANNNSVSKQLVNATQRNRVVLPMYITAHGKVNATGTYNSERSDLRTANIIDANIMPINVHGFMREIPFTNLINLSYTFDRTIAYYLGFDAPGAIALDTPCTNPEQLIAKLAIYPYANVTATEYFDCFTAVASGADKFQMGRPKYIYDQLFNKVLLGNALPALVYTHPTGPPAYDALRGARRFYTGAGPAADINKLKDELTTLRAAITTKANNLKNNFTTFSRQLFELYKSADNNYKTNNNNRLQIIDNNINLIDGEINKFVEASLTADVTESTRVAGVINVASIRVKNTIEPMLGEISENVKLLKTSVETQDKNIDVIIREIGIYSSVIDNIIKDANKIEEIIVRLNTLGVSVQKLEDEKTKLTTNNTNLNREKIALTDSNKLLTDQVKAMMHNIDRITNLNGTGKARKLPFEVKTMHYLKDGKPIAIDMGSVSNVYQLAIVGYTRFQTKIVRNIYWSVMMQRILRHVLAQHVIFLESPVNRGIKLLNPKNTEFQGNDAINETDYTGQNFKFL